jgi:YegS/Rv2252/BmrU family lipid kinase
VEYTRGPRDAERIAREAVRAGTERLVVAGGDGTLSEVANGLLAADLGGYAAIGLLPLGTGGDFARTLGIPRDLDGAIGCLAAGKVRRLDAGRVSYRDDSGRPATAYCLNVASAGVSALIVDIVNRTTKLYGGKASFLAGTVRGIARYRSEPVSVRIDGSVVSDGRLILVAAANGRYFGGGMKVAPRARPDDGLLDIVIVSGLGKGRLLAKLSKIYRGTHLDDPAVAYHRGRVLELEGPPAAARIEVDGEARGSLPARVEILPDALSVLGPAG